MKSPRKSKKKKKVLLIVTGSIAAYRAADLIRGLKARGDEVQCVLTESAKKFVAPLTLKAISGENVYDDMFTMDSSVSVLHTTLADNADGILVFPASASFIARASVGMADDLATCCLLAYKGPVLFVPTMNDNMYQNPITQCNIEVLKESGYTFMEPVVGDLVCGRHAVGHVPEVDDVIQAWDKC